MARTTAEQVTLLTDEALAQGIQQGSRDDLAALIERHHGPLTGYLYRLTDGNLPLSQDLTQETFVRLIRNIGQYTYPRRFKPWLYAIATNLARDHYKRLEQRLTEALDEVQHDQPSGNGSPEGMLLAQAETETVRTALLALPPHQREAIVLRYYQDMSLAEIAEVLGIPLGTVKSRLSLGVARLREILVNSSSQ